MASGWVEPKGGCQKRQSHGEALSWKPLTVHFWPYFGKPGCQSKGLVSTYHAILRYYCCDIPYCAILWKGSQHPPKLCDTPPPLVLSFSQAYCAIPHFATYRAITVRYPIKINTKDFCDTIATSIARYETYRCWASKSKGTSRQYVWERLGFSSCESWLAFLILEPCDLRGFAAT